MNYKAVLFDFDYTLGDATDAIYAGFTHGFTALGRPAPDRETVRHTVGMPLEEAWTMLTGDSSEPVRQEFRRLFSEVARPLQRKGVPLCAGAGELLAALRDRGVPTGVVSTKNTETLTDILAHHGLDQILALIVGGDQVAKSKPDPEGLLGAVAQLGLTPGEVLYCGDTTIDAQTALAAGADFCAVLNGTTGAEAFAAYPSVHIAPDLWDLKEWLGV